MDMDPAERGGVEWVSEICPVKGSNANPISNRPSALFQVGLGDCFRSVEISFSTAMPMVRMPAGLVGRCVALTSV